MAKAEPIVDQQEINPELRSILRDMLLEGRDGDALKMLREHLVVRHGEAEYREDRRFTETRFVCYATHTEQHDIWWRYHMHYGVPWQQEGMGWSGTIGWIGTYSVRATVSWNFVAGVRVAFPFMDSMVRHFGMFETWAESAFDLNGAETVDAANFHIIVDSIDSRAGPGNRKLRRLDSRTVEDFCRQQLHSIGVTPNPPSL